MTCANCKIIVDQTTSPQWRKGPQGKRTLCNACGLRWSRYQKKSKTVLNYVPSKIRKTKSAPKHTKRLKAPPAGTEDIDLIIRTIKYKKDNQTSSQSSIIYTKIKIDTERDKQRKGKETLLDRYNAMSKTK